MKVTLSIIVATLVAFFAASCETTEVAKPDDHSGHDHSADSGHDREEVKPLPRLRWDLRSAGSGYDLDLIVGAVENHVATGGEYMNGRRVSRSSRNVPAGTASAYEVLLPDGEVDLYWVEEGRAGSLLVYRKSYDAMDDAWTVERRLRTINY